MMSHADVTARPSHRQCSCCNSLGAARSRGPFCEGHCVCDRLDHPISPRVLLCAHLNVAGGEGKIKKSE